MAASLGFVGWTRPATAQDFGIGPQKEPSLTTSRLGVETAWARFDQQGARGGFFALTARGDLKLARNVGLRLLVPMYALQLDGQSPVVGFGDAELRARVLVYDGHPWRVYAGLAHQMPTGDTGAGLGQGGSQLSPFVTGGWRKGPVVVFASVSDAIGLHARGKPAPPDYVDPTNDDELRGNVGFITELSQAIYASAALTAVVDLDPGSTGTTLATGGLAVGYLVSEAFKLVLVGQAPIAGQHRFDEKLGLSAYLYF